MSEDHVIAGRSVSRRQFAGAALALGGALAVGPLPFAGTAAAAPTGHGRQRTTTLRHGSARAAGLLGDQLDELVTAAERYLGPSPTHPYYAGAVLLAGRGGTVALHHPIGKAVRYSGYDDKTDTGIEFPPQQQIDAARDTVYDLASLSKLFTSILAVQEVERGRLDIESAVAHYLPEYAGGGKQDITVRMLLTHTSGLQADLPFYDEPDRAARLRLLMDEAPVNPPGTVYLYSDLNMISLQLVLEKINGRPLDALVRTRITTPLGMTRTRYNPPASWKPRIAATEDERPPWSALTRGLVWGEVHDENAYAFDGVAGHAGVFSCAWDLAVLARTLLNGGAYGRARILRPDSVKLMFTNFNTAFPGDEHGLGWELYQHWYMGAMATPRTAGHTGFTGTSIVIDPTSDSFLIVLGNSVHPVRNWRTGSAPRVATGDRMARAVAVTPPDGHAAWFSGMASASTATLTLPDLALSSSRPRYESSLWWDTEPGSDFVFLEASTDAGATWNPVPFTTSGGGDPAQEHTAGSATGWSGRVWHRLSADLTAWRGKQVRLRWRYGTDPLYVGRGVYVAGQRVDDGARTAFDDRRRADASRVSADGWTRSRT
ncbi:serine hydrolase domain-containing protein [Streptomyces sp. NRRL F-5126]|uniref:serine hydrolase domain-containing protein n=1 Tax=Streptomyces sp. NRRL F-5126 TaxID=1463857 RepID=UPI0004C517D8|nr:serine hydrolase domain-containing protein [Streptomyces sp. NRRL F-5126]